MKHHDPTVPSRADHVSWIVANEAVALAQEMRISGIAVTIVVHEHKRLGRGIELAALAEQLKASGFGLEFLTGELQGQHDPTGIVFTVLAALSGMEREYIRDRTLEGHESARKRGKTIGGATVVGDDMLDLALHLRGQGMSLRDIAGRLVITKGKKKGHHPSPPRFCGCFATTTTTTPRPGPTPATAVRTPVSCWCKPTGRSQAAERGLRLFMYLVPRSLPAGRLTHTPSTADRSTLGLGPASGFPGLSEGDPGSNRRKSRIWHTAG